MGGKTWSKEEECLFWQVIVPQSPQAAKQSDRQESWEACAAIMQQKMGEPRRRTYTRTMLYEHYYQNVKTGSHSPRAREFVREHNRQLKIEAENAVMSPKLSPSSSTGTQPMNEAASSPTPICYKTGAASGELGVSQNNKRRMSPHIEEPAPKRHFPVFPATQLLQKMPAVPHYTEERVGNGHHHAPTQATAWAPNAFQWYPGTMQPNAACAWQSYAPVPRPRDSALNALLWATSVSSENSTPFTYSENASAVSSGSTSMTGSEDGGQSHAAAPVAEMGKPENPDSAKAE